MSGWTQPPEGSGTLPASDDPWHCHDLPGAALRRVTPPYPSDDAGSEPGRLLLRTVETEIIPRLMLLHRGGKPTPARSKAHLRIGEHEVMSLTDLVLKAHEPAADFVTSLVRRGAALEAIYLNLLAAVARRLGDLWSADLCSFTDVTIALGRLQRIAFDLVDGDRLPRSDGGAGRRALLMPVPGEHHTFGLTLVCEFFRSSGWEVWTDSSAKHEALVELVRDHWFDVVGFSIGNDRRIDPLAELIRAIRRISRNRTLRVLVGGPLLVQQPELAARLGADASAHDARQAMLAAERLVAARDSR